MENSLSIRPLDQLAGAIMTLPACHCPLIEMFTPGLYSRELHFPKGSVSISKIHKSEHQFVIAKGCISIWTKDGVIKYKAPHVGITTPGTQRAFYAHEDTVWITFHPTTETDPAKIEQQIIQEPDEGSVTISEEAIRQLCHSSQLQD